MPQAAPIRKSRTGASRPRRRKVLLSIFGLVIVCSVVVGNVKENRAKEHRSSCLSAVERGRLPDDCDVGYCPSQLSWRNWDDALPVGCPPPFGCATTGRTNGDFPTICTSTGKGEGAAS
jgi:hypothetical protein